MRLILGLLLICSNAAYGGACDALLEGSALKAILRQIERVNPELVGTFGPIHDPEEIFLSLKREEEKYADAKELPLGLKSWLLENQSQIYDLAGTSDADLVQFYLNALQGLYTRAGEAWKAQELTVLVEGSLSHLQDKVARALLDQFFQPFGMPDSHLSVTTAEKALAGNEWSDFPWEKAMAYIAEWEASRAAKDVYFSFFDFSRWLDQRAGQELGATHQQALSLAISRAHTFQVCCRSTPGCHACPQNRKWIKPKDERK